MLLFRSVARIPDRAGDARKSWLTRRRAPPASFLRNGGETAAADVSSVEADIVILIGVNRAAGEADPDRVAGHQRLGELDHGRRASEKPDRIGAGGRRG